jgi:hypothetical protein
MKTEATNSITSSSKITSVLTLCLVALAISIVITSLGKIDFRQFAHNLLEWQTI